DQVADRVLDRRARRQAQDEDALAVESCAERGEIFRALDVGAAFEPSADLSRLVIAQDLDADVREALCHARAHPAESDDSNLHQRSSNVPLNVLSDSRVSLRRWISSTCCNGLPC